jgi:hypothetical protein
LKTEGVASVQAGCVSLAELDEFGLRADFVSERPLNSNLMVAARFAKQYMPRMTCRTSIGIRRSRAHTID